MRLFLKLSFLRMNSSHGNDRWKVTLFAILCQKSLKNKYPNLDPPEQTVSPLHAHQPVWKENNKLESALENFFWTNTHSKNTIQERL
jgi:uncharacterized phage-like protein YoqJ